MLNSFAYAASKGYGSIVGGDSVILSGFRNWYYCGLFPRLWGVARGPNIIKYNIIIILSGMVFFGND